MKNLFFYGTLAHRPLLELVLGRAFSETEAQAAELANFKAYWVKDQVYPALISQEGSFAKGLVVKGLSDLEIARLDFYEGGFEYTLHPAKVKTSSGFQAADVYFPDQSPSIGTPWVLADWQAEWGDLTVQAAREVMGYFGQISIDELAIRFGPIRQRAAAFLWGQSERARVASFERSDVLLQAHRTPYSNFYTLQEYELQHRQFSGEMGPTIERSVFTGFDAAIVLPYDPKRDCVLLIEQFRIGAYARGAKQPWLLEPVAGHVDLGETPEQAAVRETHEEAGLHVERLIAINQAYPSPGSSSDFFHIFLGICDLDGAGGGTFGVQSEHEDIHSHILPFDQAMEFAAGRAPFQGGANVLPLITALYWLALNRERLRKDA